MHISVTADHNLYNLEAAPFSEYVLNVAAVNSVGRGPFSSTRIVRTLEDGKFTSFKGNFHDTSHSIGCIQFQLMSL